MTRRFAEDTSVPAERTKAEIEKTVVRYGADGFMTGWDSQQNSAMVSFRHNGRYIRITLPMPTAAEFKRDRWDSRNHETRVAQATRQRWRALLLVVKAKLEAVASKVATFDQEFMPYIVMPDGRTAGEIALPQIAEAYRTGATRMRLLPGAVEGEVVHDEV